jgi:hypothetical protein
MLKHFHQLWVSPLLHVLNLFNLIIRGFRADTRWIFGSVSRKNCNFFENSARNDTKGVTH